jgi:NADH dehydrogenase
MILVTGGSGFVGREIVRQLLARGQRVRVLARHPETGRMKRPNLETMRGDVLQPETLVPAMAGVQAVIHLVGIIVETPRRSFAQMHVEATRNVLAAARQAGVTRWLQMSALGTRPGAASRYHQTKWDAEELVRASGLDWTIFRPSLIYGTDENDRIFRPLRMALTKPVDLLLFRSFPVIDNGESRVQPVCVRDVAACFVRALGEPRSIGRVYELTGPFPLSWRELVTAVAARLGRPVTVERVPVLLPLRVLLCTLVALLPLILLLALILRGLTLPQAEIGALLWVVLLVVAIRWRSILLVNLPSGPLWLLGQTLEMIAPQGFRCSDQVALILEDNIGDPGPAAELFHVQPESLSTALDRLLAPAAS